MRTVFSRAFFLMALCLSFHSAQGDDDEWDDEDDSSLVSTDDDSKEGSPTDLTDSVNGIQTSSVPVVSPSEVVTTETKPVVCSLAISRLRSELAALKAPYQSYAGELGTAFWLWLLSLKRTFNEKSGDIYFHVPSADSLHTATNLQIEAAVELELDAGAGKNACTPAELEQLNIFIDAVAAWNKRLTQAQDNFFTNSAATGVAGVATVVIAAQAMAAKRRTKDIADLEAARAVDQAAMADLRAAGGVGGGIGAGGPGGGGGAPIITLTDADYDAIITAALGGRRPNSQPGRDCIMNVRRELSNVGILFPATRPAPR